MKLPDYWLNRPPMNLDDATQASFETLLSETIVPDTLEQVECPEIQYNLPVPKWQFLCWAADQKNLAVHGSGNAHIAVFEPRQSNDLNEFGNQKAVYAAGDGLWAMFFAIVDREHYGMSVSNACIYISEPNGIRHGPFYVFSVSQTTLPKAPWRDGKVYLLPRDSFVNQDLFEFGPNKVYIPQLASLTAVRPLAKLTVTPQDFPFLAQIRGHDDERLSDYAHAMETGSAWPGEAT